MEVQDIVLVITGSVIALTYLTAYTLKKNTEALDAQLKAEGKYTAPLKIVSVKTLDAFKLDIIFNDGVQKVFNAFDFLGHLTFSNLRDAYYFNKVSIDRDGEYVRWKEGEEFGVDMLYVRGE